MTKRYWLFKSEPESFSWDDLERAPERTTCWNGVRNYQVRNILRDDIQVGDGVLFYHSSTEPLAVVGTCEVVRAGYPDGNQFDPNSNEFDRGAQESDPRWYMVDIRAAERFPKPITLEKIKQTKSLASMSLLQVGSRLSIQPVTATEWRVLTKMGGLTT